LLATFLIISDLSATESYSVCKDFIQLKDNLDVL
jgi:hypothetical protein